MLSIGCNGVHDNFGVGLGMARQQEISDESAKVERKKGSDGAASLAVELRVAIMRTSRRLRNESVSKDLTPAQYSVLVAVGREATTVGVLAEQESVQAPSMTRIVAGLVASGLVTKDVGEKDKRQVLVKITEAGRKEFRQARSKRTAWLAKRVADLNPEERETLHRAALILTAMSAQ